MPGVLSYFSRVRRPLTCPRAAFPLHSLPTPVGVFLASLMLSCLLNTFMPWAHFLWKGLGI